MQLEWENAALHERALEAEQMLDEAIEQEVEAELAEHPSNAEASPDPPEVGGFAALFAL